MTHSPGDAPVADPEILFDMRDQQTDSVSQVVIRGPRREIRGS